MDEVLSCGSCGHDLRESTEIRENMDAIVEAHGNPIKENHDWLRMCIVFFSGDSTITSQYLIHRKNSKTYDVNPKI